MPTRSDASLVPMVVKQNTQGPGRAQRAVRWWPILVFLCPTLVLWIASCFYVLEARAAVVEVALAGGDCMIRWGRGIANQGFCATPASPSRVEVTLPGILLVSERVESLRPFGTLPYVGRGLFGQDYRVSLPLWMLLFAQVAAVGMLIARRYRRRAGPGVCAECGYSLVGNVSARCPECGARVCGSPRQTREAR